jgi:SWI/SNF related-matrix-associated actin-dependent regulator of chromatin subfamily C
MGRRSPISPPPAPTHTPTHPTQAQQSRRFPKLPARLFEDVTPKTGALHQIAALLWRLARQRGSRTGQFDWANAARRRELLEVLAGLRRELENRGHVKAPVVYVSANRFGQAEAGRLRDAVRRLGGRVVQDADLRAGQPPAGTTHVLVTTGRRGASMDEAAGRNTMRTLLVDDESGLARVHWLYLPSSYDEWVPSGAAPPAGSVGLGPAAHEPWPALPAPPLRVYAQWVADSDRYNEWMDDADYVEDAVEAAAAAKAAGVALPKAAAATAAAGGGAAAGTTAAAVEAAAAAAAGGAAAAAAAANKQEAASIAKMQVEAAMGTGEGGGAGKDKAAGGAPKEAAAPAAGTAAAPAAAPAAAAGKPPAGPAGAAGKGLKSALKPTQPQPKPGPPEPVVVLTPAQQQAAERQQVAVVQAAKRARLEAQLPEVDPSPGATVALGPQARQRRAVAPARGAMDGGGAGENISHGQLAPWMPSAGVGYAHQGPHAPYFGPTPLPAAGGAAGAAVAAVGAAATPTPSSPLSPAELRVYEAAARWAVEHSLPTQAHWFRMGKGRVHELERHRCREFFLRRGGDGQEEKEEAAAAANGSGTTPSTASAPTPASYVEWRDLIVEEWRRRAAAATLAIATGAPTPPEPLPVRLTPADARRLAPRAEVEALRALLRSLEFWGIVNGPSVGPCAQELSAALTRKLEEEEEEEQQGQQPEQQQKEAAAQRKALASRAAEAVVQAVRAATHGGARLVAHPAGAVPAAPPGARALFTFTHPTIEEAVDAATTRGGLLSFAPARDGVHAPAVGGGGRRAGGGLNPAQAEAAALALVAAPGQRVYCSAMPHVDCTELRFHCVRHPDVRLCPDAFVAGLFPPGTTARDFVRVDQRRHDGEGDDGRERGGNGGDDGMASASVGVDGRALRVPEGGGGGRGGAGAGAATGAANNKDSNKDTNDPSSLVVPPPPAGEKATAGPPWTRLEDYLLLEAIEATGVDDWGLVAERVGTRSEVQCMLRFASLPIEEALHEAAPLPPALMAKVERLAPGAAAAAAQRAPNGAGAGAVLAAVVVDQQGGGGAAVTAKDAADADAFARASSRILGARDGMRVPFLDADNPVASVVAFVFSTLGGRLSSYAAQAALEVMVEDDPCAAAAVRLGIEEAWRPTGSGGPGGGGADAMAVDKDNNTKADGNGNAAAEEADEEVLAKRPLTRAHNVAAAAVALAYAATRARLMAELNEREIQRMMNQVVENQLRKVDAKTAWLEGGCEAGDGDGGDEEEDDGDDEGGDGAGGKSLHASILADTRYLLRARESTEKQIAELLKQQAEAQAAAQK